MKKLFSLILLFAAIFMVSNAAFAAEIPVERIFGISCEDDFSPEEVYSYASEKGFNGILIDFRESDSARLYSKYVNAARENEHFVIYSIVEEENLHSFKSGTSLVFTKNISEEDIAKYSESSKGEYLSFLIPFGDEEAFKIAKDFYGKGYFKTLFVENLFSCHSEFGYEEYLLELSEEFPNAKIITINNLGKVLSPSLRGDFYADPFEINNQYLVNKLNGFGFCVSDYSDLTENIGGRADFLINYFDSSVLDTYADFSVSKRLEITRPVSSYADISTNKYSIFGTSDPEKPLYMNGTEIERISSSGVFAVTVELTESENIFNFTQSGISDSVVLKFGSGSSNSGSGTTSKLSSCSPSQSKILNPKSTKINLSCVGPSGGKVTAKIGDKTVVLKQAAYADNGVPAKFTGEIKLSGKYPEDETTLIGKVVYTLTYGGKTTEYESSGSVFYVGKDSSLVIRANAELAGIERADSDNGDYLTTLRTGCYDYVTDISENGWYKVSCGGYIKPSHCDIVTGKNDITCKISSAEREFGENYEKLNINSSAIPAFKGEIKEKTLVLTLYNTEYSNISGVDINSELMRRIVEVDNGDGSITLNIYSTEELWGWDIFTDPESNSFSIVLKGKPELSEDPSKPLSGITIALCAGHGGTDPGALSVAGEKGVNEFQINLAHTMAFSESLENLGAEIILLVAGEEKMGTYERMDPARYGYSDLYICCHSNSVAESSPANLWCGTYVYYHYAESADFAKLLCDYISASTKRDNEGARADYYSVTRFTMCPAVMLEIGFVSNPREFDSLIDKCDIQKTAFAVTKAVLEICDN